MGIFRSRFIRQQRQPFSHTSGDRSDPSAGLLCPHTPHLPVVPAGGRPAPRLPGEQLFAPARVGRDFGSLGGDTHGCANGSACGREAQGTRLRALCSAAGGYALRPPGGSKGAQLPCSTRPCRQVMGGTSGQHLPLRQSSWGAALSRALGDPLKSCRSTTHSRKDGLPEQPGSTPRSSHLPAQSPPGPWGCPCRGAQHGGEPPTRPGRATDSAHTYPRVVARFPSS